MTRAAIISFLIVLFSPVPLLAVETEIAALPAVLTGDTLSITVPLAALLTTEDSLSLVNGETLSLVCRLEYWQKRKMWFDRLRFELVNYAELTFDRWEERFRATCYGAEGGDFEIENQHLDSVVSEVTARLVFPFRLEASDYSRESYLAYSIELRYLTPDRLSELKDWLFSGKGKHDRQPRSQQRSFPGKLIDLALSSTGFRNRSYLKSSFPFYPGQISGSIKFPTSLNK